MFKIWFLAINSLIAAWVLIDAKSRHREKWAWSAGAFLFTIVALPAYLVRSRRRPLVAAVAGFIYCLAVLAGMSVLAGMPYARIESFIKQTPLMKTASDATTDFWHRPASGSVRWANMEIIAVGTSITAGASGRFLDGFVDQAVRWHKAELINHAVGSSGIVWDGQRERSLSATREELMKAGFDPAQSFEAKLLGTESNLIIFDHGYNDREHPIGSIDDVSPATFYGAYNRVIQSVLADRPDTPMLFLTPPSLYTPYAGGEINQNTVAIRQAILAVARKYRSPVMDMSMQGGFDGASSDARSFPDGVHPNSKSHRHMAILLYRFLAGLPADSLSEEP